MFSRRSHKSLPLGWSRRHLTYWDCCQFGRKDSPTIGWIFEGNDIDRDNLSTALQRAVQRRAPWLRGRLAKTESGSPPFEIHVPPSDSSARAFDVTVSVIPGNLSSVISYFENGTPNGAVETFPAYDPAVFNPHAAISGIEEYVSKDLPLLHLHFIDAKDATLISLCWSHAVMDALGCAQIVKAWEQEVSCPDSSKQFPDAAPSTFFSFTDKVTLDKSWKPPGWLTLSSWELLKVIVPYYYELYTNPLVDGSVFIPASLIALWTSSASDELGDGEWVSRNDLVTAWIFKYAWGAAYFKDEDWNTMFSAICFRGRHNALQNSLITNTAKSHVVPSITTLELRSMSLTKVALRLRRSMEPYKNPEYVEKAVAYEFRSMKNGNGATSEIPLGRIEARVFGATSWAKLGFSNPQFKEHKIISCLTYNTGRGCATIIDGSEGDWRVDYKMSARAWTALRQQMDRENKTLSSNSVS